jgi:hypothetical protein
MNESETVFPAFFPSRELSEPTSHLVSKDKRGKVTKENDA